MTAVSVSIAGPDEEGASTLPAAVQIVEVIAVDGTVTGPAERQLPEEVPVAVVCNGTTQAVMMTTPEHLDDFALGFAWTEGYVQSLDEIEEFELVVHPAGIEARFWLETQSARALQARRRSMVGPVGCGLCGIDSLDQVGRALPRLDSAGPRLTAGEIARATEALREDQPLHDRTRAMHAAGFLLPGRGLVLVREDVGRHNALDKLVGAILRGGLPAAEGAVVLSSRVSVEMVQKTVMAGVPAMIAASAPTHHALRVAREANLTLVARARAGRFDIYNAPERIAP